jgi:DNA-binding NarL/FixJ family response regulator
MVIVNDETYHVLLIEDELAIADWMQGLLLASPCRVTSREQCFSWWRVASLAEANFYLEAQAVDIVVLDLGLQGPEQTGGLTILSQLREQLPAVALVVYTKDDNETLIIQAFQYGADGYLRLQTLDTNLLTYELLSAKERQSYRNNLARQQNLARQEQEFLALESLAASSTSITARLFGSETLQEYLPEIFAELSQSYGQLLDLALEQRIYRVDHNLSEHLRILADKMGFLKASPRDIIELHTVTLREKNQDVSLAKAQGYVTEGRLLVLELMGYLATFYRKYYIGLSRLNLTAKS